MKKGLVIHVLHTTLHVLYTTTCTAHHMTCTVHHITTCTAHHITTCIVRHIFIVVFSCVICRVGRWVVDGCTGWSVGGGWLCGNVAVLLSYLVLCADVAVLLWYLLLCGGGRRVFVCVCRLVLCRLVCHSAGCSVFVLFVRLVVPVLDPLWQPAGGTRCLTQHNTTQHNNTTTTSQQHNHKVTTPQRHNVTQH